MQDTFKKDALTRLETIFRDQFLDDSIRVTEQTSPEQIEEWDSLAHVNLLAAVEAGFGVRFTADEMSSITDVSTLLGTLNAKLAKR